MSKKLQKILKFLANMKLSAPGFFCNYLNEKLKINNQLRQINSEISNNEMKKSIQTITNLNFAICSIFMLITGDFIKYLLLEFVGIIAINVMPSLYLKVLISKRKSHIFKELPGTIESIALSLESGINLKRSIEQICKNNKGVIANELCEVLNKKAFGFNDEFAFEDLKNKINQPEMTSVIDTLQRTKNTGASLSEILKIQSELIKTKRLQIAYEKARKASVKISIPLVFFIFPSLLIIYLGPGIIRLISN